MKRQTLRIAILSALVVLLSDQLAWTTCRKKRRKKKAGITQVTPSRDTLKADVAIGNRHQLVCRFISIGSGIDLNARKQLGELLVSIAKKSGKALTYDERSWGREGERDLCFHDNSKEQIQELYSQLKKLFDQNRRVFIELNAVCK